MDRVECIDPEAISENLTTKIEKEIGG